MCGRFVLTIEFEKLLDFLQLRYSIKKPTKDYNPRFNIAPGQQVLSVINDGKNYRSGYLNWGFIPHWAKDSSIGYRMINSRSETIDTNNSFKSSFTSKRCIIISDGFYEWEKKNNQKLPHLFSLKNNSAFSFAGIWSKWTPDNLNPIYSCSIITTNANSIVKPIHDRMPVILNEETEKIWLDTSIKDASILKSVLSPYEANKMTSYRVSTIVNSSKNESHECIHPLIT